MREEREKRERSMTLKSGTVTHGFEISLCFGMYIDYTEWGNDD